MMPIVMITRVFMMMPITFPSLAILLLLERAS
jgi:hypothetical protein